MNDRHEWRDRLRRAAECGSDCLRDTWATVPQKIKDELGMTQQECAITAMAADIARREDQ